MGAGKRRQLLQRENAYTRRDILGRWLGLAHNEDGGEGIEPGGIKGFGSQHHSAVGVQERRASHHLSQVLGAIGT